MRLRKKVRGSNLDVFKHFKQLQKAATQDLSSDWFDRVKLNWAWKNASQLKAQLNVIIPETRDCNFLLLSVKNNEIINQKWKVVY